MTVTIEKIGRRHYIVGNTYPIKDQLRSAGCNWDPDRKQWWTGKSEVAERFAGKEVTGDDLRVIGRANYKGKEYYVVWTGPTKYGTGWKLAFKDGSKVFWAKGVFGETPMWTKRYEEPQTIGDLRAFAKRQQSRRENKPQTTVTSSEPLNSPPQQARQGELLMQDSSEYCEGDVLGLLVTDAEIAAIREAGVEPVEIPATPNAKPTPAGRTRIAVYVTAEWSYTEDEAEDFDYFDRRFFASARAATVEEAQPLIERREKAAANDAAGKTLGEIVAALPQCESRPDWATDETLAARWRKPVMVHTGAYPSLYIYRGQAYYHVPGYFACDWAYPAVHRCGSIDDEQMIRDLISSYDGCK